MTHSDVDNMKDLQQQCENFRNDVSELISQYGAQNVFNSDQSGFNLEMHSGRTLCYEGAKNVECVAQSLSSITHSYAIQSTVSADEKLL